MRERRGGGGAKIIYSPKHRLDFAVAKDSLQILLSALAKKKNGLKMVDRCSVTGF